MIRLRMSAKDAHYGGNLVDGAHMVHLFGDVATELLIMHDGDEGLFVAYDNVELLPAKWFSKPVRWSLPVRIFQLRLRMSWLNRLWFAGPVEPVW